MEMTLKEIENEIKNCKTCRKDKKGLPVPGEGPSDAGAMFIGMAPGKKESETGRPFVGRAGKFLNEMLESIGINREDVYITSPVKYYPGDRNLRKEEIRHGAEHLKKQIEVLSPELVVLMGDVAAEAVFPEKDIKVTEDHGKTYRKEGTTYFVTFHPAAGMRFPKIRKMMKKDFQKIASLA
ncbi:uracil-DNA glycosylase [Candidatus Micrarchaeota archaeon]|nr:uracil-DNA glycosylase [Candidatus Micrarchaeota archaeon]